MGISPNTYPGIPHYAANHSREALERRVADELANWVGDANADDYEVSRKVVDNYGTTVVVVRSTKDLYRVYRGFAMGTAAGVSVDLDYSTVGALVDHLLDRYGQ